MNSQAQIQSGALLLILNALLLPFTQNVHTNLHHLLFHKSLVYLLHSSSPPSQASAGIAALLNSLIDVPVSTHAPSIYSCLPHGGWQKRLLLATFPLVISTAGCSRSYRDMGKQHTEPDGQGASKELAATLICSLTATGAPCSEGRKLAAFSELLVFCFLPLVIPVAAASPSAVGGAGNGA